VWSRSGPKPGELLDRELLDWELLDRELLDWELELELELELPLPLLPLLPDPVDDEPLAGLLERVAEELPAGELDGGAEVVTGTEAAELDGDAAPSEPATVSGRTCTWVSGAREVVVRCCSATNDTVTTLPRGSSVPLGDTAVTAPATPSAPGTARRCTESPRWDSSSATSSTGLPT
jgi:hypothetical protein